jgi:hypothetical protein
VRPGLRGTFTARLKYDVAPIPFTAEPTPFVIN